MSGRPDAGQVEAARMLEVEKRLREVEREILGRAPEHDVEPSLDRIRAVMELLGDPQRTFPVIHLTGTNGKTSTTRMIETLCREHGLTTGRFTSPHLHSVRERIAIAGQPISAERLLAVYDEVLPYIEVIDARSAESGGPRMTFFEVFVALAYAAFADAPVDVAVVEVGMGGGWDATNIADGSVAVITPIAIDHTHFLGTTVEEIAHEKSGIIKAGAIAVSSIQGEDVATILLDRSEEVGARVVFEANDFGVIAREVAVGGQQLSFTGLAGEYPDVFLPLHGAHQASNAAAALAAVEAFLGGGERRLDPDVVRDGFAKVTSPGRLEVVRRSPTVLVDAAHNPAGMTALVAALEDSFAFTRLVGVVGIFADKEPATMLEILEPLLEHVVVTRNSSPRSMSPRELGALATEIFGEDRVTVVQDLPDALEQAVTIAETDGLGGGVLVTGSVITAADARMLLGSTET
jgi:dihydrofolate synthase/folylpolyglutamate synthase